MSCLLNLLEWSGVADPEERARLLRYMFGEFYYIIHWFAAHDQPPWQAATMPSVWTAPLLAQGSVARAVQWRLSILWGFIHREGILRSCFPVEERPYVWGELHALVDSLIPLSRYLDVAEAAPDVATVYSLQLAPEQCLGQVIDSTCVAGLLEYFVPVIYTGPAVELWLTPPPLTRMLGCNPSTATDVRAIRLLYSLLRRTVFRKTGVRNFLGVLHAALATATPDWLSPAVVLIVKCVLLGNYPGVDKGLDWTKRRLLYAWTWQDVLAYFRSCNQGARSTDKDADTRVEMATIGQVLAIFLHPTSHHSGHHRQFVQGWEAYSECNEHLLDLSRCFFPAQPSMDSINGVYKLQQPLVLLYADIVYALNSRNKTAIKGHWPRLHELATDWQTITTIGPLIAVLCEWSMADYEIGKAMQRAFDGTISALEPFLQQLSSQGRALLLSLATWIAGRRVFRIFPTNHHLTLKQYLRLLEIDPSQAPFDYSLVLHCRCCDTVRTKPIGPDLTGSQVTVQVRMHWMTLSCMECDSEDLECIDLTGKVVRCFLNNKKNPGCLLVAICSSCHHITSIEADHFIDEGPVCNECYVTNTNTYSIAAATPKTCINQCPLAVKPVTRHNHLLVADATGAIAPTALCPSCMPPDLRPGINRETVYGHAELRTITARRLQRFRQQGPLNTRYKHRRSHPA